MKTTKQKLILGTAIIGGIAACVLIFSFGTVMGQEFYHSAQAHNGTTGKIEEVLKKNCNCDAQFGLSTFGIHFSKEDGVNGNTVEFTLKEYPSDTSIAEEAARLNMILNAEVDGYSDLDVVQLNFMDEEQENTITIKKGIIQ